MSRKQLEDNYEAKPRVGEVERRITTPQRPTIATAAEVADLMLRMPVAEVVEFSGIIGIEVNVLQGALVRMAKQQKRTSS